MVVVVVLLCLLTSASASATVEHPRVTRAATGITAASDGSGPVEDPDQLAVEASLVLRGLAVLGRGVTQPTDTPAPRWRWPLLGPHRVHAHFDGPAQPWLPGHRGADLTGYDGLSVLSVADGVVAYSGSINGVGVVSVQHGDGLRSTYQPVGGPMATGDAVRAGQRIGHLETLGSHCWPRSCLHLGARRGTAYLDPLLLLGAWEVSLLPRS